MVITLRDRRDAERACLRGIRRPAPNLILLLACRIRTPCPRSAEVDRAVETFVSGSERIEQVAHGRHHTASRREDRVNQTRPCPKARQQVPQPTRP